MKFRKILVKYCGGCNPQYDRVEMIQQAQSLLKNRFIFFCDERKDFSAVVFVNGCPRACANEDLKEAEVSFRSVTGKKDFDDLIKWLSSRLNGIPCGDDNARGEMYEENCHQG